MYIYIYIYPPLDYPLPNLIPPACALRITSPALPIYTGTHIYITIYTHTYVYSTPSLSHTHTHIYTPLLCQPFPILLYPFPSLYFLSFPFLPFLSSCHQALQEGEHPPRFHPRRRHSYGGLCPPTLAPVPLKARMLLTWVYKLQARHSFPPRYIRPISSSILSHPTHPTHLSYVRPTTSVFDLSFASLIPVILRSIHVLDILPPFLDILSSFLDTFSSLLS